MNRLAAATLAACVAVAANAADTAGHDHHGADKKGAQMPRGVTVSIYEATASGRGQKVGEVTLSDSQYGLVLTPNLQGLSQGLYGFHVHENPSCEPARQDGRMVPALAAGGHYDPKDSGYHSYPWGDGHLGDLPALYVNEQGVANYPVLAPRLSVEQVRERSLMVHVGSDNHSDHPKPLGGGGARMLCGVIE